MKTPSTRKPIALITGGADRLGKEMALFLAKQGYHLVLHYHTSQVKAEETAKQIDSQQGSCEFLQADFHQDGAVEKLLNLLPDGLVDALLINNASQYYPSEFSEAGTEAFDTMMNLHLKIPYMLSKAFAKKVSQGHIINMIDAKFTANTSRYFDYLLSKKCLASLTQMLAVSLAPHIRVNGIAPGIILPPPNKGQEYIDQLAQHIPLKRAGSPQSIVHALQYLLQGEFITGEILFLDGGDHLGESGGRPF